MTTLRIGLIGLAASVAAWFGGAAQAAGTLTPSGSPHAPIEIRDHHVEVVIQDGFARTAVTQSFYNPNAVDLEGVYAFPLPAEASLAEITIYAGERVLEGEVLSDDEADRIYGEERDAGNDAGLGRKEGIQRFEFYVTPIRAQDETRMRFVYYEPLEIDTGVGRYLYPLEEGGTDERARSFWMTNEQVTRDFSIDVALRTSVPIAELRTPGYEGAARIEAKGEGEHRVRIESQAGALDRDFVLYYRLADGLPGRVELLPYKPDADEPGHFMLVVTPGVDLQPLRDGSDYVFVLDNSGSMAGKLSTLTAGVRQAIGELGPNDRFRVIVFSNDAREVVGWTPATPDRVAAALARVASIRTEGGTNVYSGLKLALDDLEADRVTSLVLVTDGVTNTGVVDPKAFHALMQKADVRVFGFLMGNSANWPLMRVICETSGGYYTGVSNADDVLGQVLLAKSKVTHEALHDVELHFDGVRVTDMTGKAYRKVHRGEQLVLFGRYEDGGELDLALDLRISGEDQRLETRFAMPDMSTAYPEVERLFALAHVDEIEWRTQAGLLDGDEAATSIEFYGTEYQIVTDETSMVVLTDEAFARHGIERRNQQRTAVEHAVQAQRAQAPVQPTRVDRHQPMFDAPAPRLGSGFFGPDHAAGIVALWSLILRRWRREDEGESASRGVRQDKEED